MKRDRPQLKAGSAESFQGRGWEGGVVAVTHSTSPAGRLGSQGDDDPGDLSFLGIDGVTGCYR